MFAFAHDMRGFLRTALTRIQMVQAGAGSSLPETDRTFLDEAAAAAGEMNKLLSAMVAYCDAERLADTSDTTSLGLMVRGVIMEMQSVLKDVEITVGESPDVRTPSAVRSVIRELIANSLRFRQRERPLRIDVQSLAAEKRVRIAVSDNGIGVAPEWHERIFEPFQRMHARSEYPGYGLGLAQSKKIVEALGGKISAQTSEHGGLRVEAELPAE